MGKDKSSQTTSPPSVASPLPFDRSLTTRRSAWSYSFQVLVVMVLAANWILFIYDPKIDLSISPWKAQATSDYSVNSRSTTLTTRPTIAMQLITIALADFRAWLHPLLPPPEENPPRPRAEFAPKVNSATIALANFETSNNRQTETSKSTTKEFPFPWRAVLLLVVLTTFVAVSAVVVIIEALILKRVLAAWMMETKVRHDKDDSESAVISFTSPAAYSQIKLFRARARLMQVASFASLLLIVITISLGVTLFYVAGRLANEEQAGELRDLARYIGFEMERLTDRRSNYGVSRSDSESENEKMDTLRTEIGKWKTEIGESIKEHTANSTTQTLISTTVTRIGAVAMLIFLVQILVTMYRYNTRLCAYYHGRADAIQLSSGLDVDQIARLTELLTPTGIDFGKLPSTPLAELRHAVDGLSQSAKDLAESSKPKVG